MMEVGEETGQLGTMLEELAKFYEQEVEFKTKNINTIIEPVILIIMGLGVGFFVFSMLKPIYSILQQI